ncbi:hypothetical protein ACP70R_018841 [Stipagrostis hirtigluma subsp. patula]
MAVGGGSEVATCTPAFVARVVRSRWFMLFASMMVMAASGATYIFALYSKELRSTLGYNQQALNTLSFFKDLGGNIGIVAGLVQQVAPTWVMLLVGAAMNLGGYLMIYLALTARITAPPLWLMCLYISIGANGGLTFAHVGALVSCVNNFPESRGFVIGLLKGFVGLSGGIYTQLYFAIYGDDAKSLVLLIAWLPAIVYILFVHTIRVMPYTRRHDQEVSRNNQTFLYFLYISIALAVDLLVMIVLQKKVQFSHAAYVVSATALLVILFLPLGVVIRAEHKAAALLGQSLQQPPTIAVEAPTASEKTGQPSPPLGRGGFGCVTSMFKPPAFGDDYSIVQAVVSVEMLVLLVVSASGIGGTLTAIDNMAQIGQSLGYPEKSISTFVSLISIWNFAGRVGAGYLSEILLSRYRFPRPMAMTAVLLVSCVGHLLIAFGVPQSLYAASVIIGFCFGAHWPLLFSIISEVFGLKYYATLVNIGCVSSPLGNYLLNVRVAGRMYDGEAARQHGSAAGVSGDKVCMGVACFKRAFLVITAVTFLSALVSLVLVWRTKGFYQGDIYAKFKLNGAIAADGRNAGAETGMEASAQPEEEQEKRRSKNTN